MRTVSEVPIVYSCVQINLWNKDTSLMRTVSEVPILYSCVQINLWNKDTSLMRTVSEVPILYSCGVCVCVATATKQWQKHYSAKNLGNKESTTRLSRLRIALTLGSWKWLLRPTHDEESTIRLFKKRYTLLCGLPTWQFAIHCSCTKLASHTPCIWYHNWWLVALDLPTCISSAPHARPDYIHVGSLASLIFNNFNWLVAPPTLPHPHLHELRPSSAKRFNSDAV